MQIDLKKIVDQDPLFQNYMARICGIYPGDDGFYPLDIIYCLYNINTPLDKAIQFLKVMDMLHPDCCEGHEDEGMPVEC